jgi:PAS domain S-box-containing protein
MLIMWGKDKYTQFYNDAFIEIQGKKHPKDLGMSGKEVWDDVWSDVGPLIENVFNTGELVFMKDLPLILNRNGYDEQTYFTFSYSSIRDETDNIAGMYCVCIETTEQAKSEIALRAERQRFRDLLMQAPAIIAVLNGPEHVFTLANPLYMRIVGNREVLGKSVREALPELEGQGFFEILDEVYRTGKSYSGNEAPVKLGNGKGVENQEIFVNFVYQPSRGASGEVDGILAHAVDVTESVKPEKE